MEVIWIVKGTNSGYWIECCGDFREFTARMQIRRHPRSEAVLAEFSTEAGQLVIEEHGILLNFDQNETAEWKFRRGVFDIMVTDPAGRTVQVAHGKIFVVPGVTR